MQHKFLNEMNNEKIIVFFSGWGMDENSVQLKYNNYDFIVFYNYENNLIDNGIINKINGYKEIYLISWSMGVIFATNIINRLNNIKLNIAINGTLKIINDNFGISEKIFNTTLSNLNLETINAFVDNMFVNKNENIFISNRDINSKINELNYIKNYYFSNNFTANFDKILIGKYDKIVPFSKQKKYWINDNYIILNSGHYVFNLFNSWEEVIYAR